MLTEVNHYTPVQMMGYTLTHCQHLETMVNHHDTDHSEPLKNPTGTPRIAHVMDQNSYRYNYYFELLQTMAIDAPVPTTRHNALATPRHCKP